MEILFPPLSTGLDTLDVLVFEVTSEVITYQEFCAPSCLDIRLCRGQRKGTRGFFYIAQSYHLWEVNIPIKIYGILLLPGTALK